MTSFNDTLIKASKQQPAEHIPVWFMRQAGRYQKEYRVIREKYDIISICKTPKICAEVTLLPVQQFEVDAAIIFSDIMIPLEPMGINFSYKSDIGPQVHNPIQDIKDVEALKDIIPEKSLNFTGEALQLLKEQLIIPCIGFVGAPFTLASYMIEGGASKHHIKLKTFMYTQPEGWHLLMDKLAKAMAKYLNYQIDNGASVVQIFDSWVGCLSYEDYKVFVLPHMKQMLHQIKSHSSTPVILFGVGTAHLLELMKEADSDVIGLDWRVDIKEEWKKLNYEVAVQGNLDPALLFAPWELIEKKARQILDQVDRDGFIFNLGHGILPHTPVDNVKRLAELVHSY